MTNIYNFGTIGVGLNVQYGKGGGRLVYNSGADEFRVRNSANSAYIPIKVGTPVDAEDATTKAYVDAAIEGLSPKSAVRAATTAAATLGTDFENGDTIDGIVLATGDRILIKDQTTASENGIYVVAAAGAPSRSADANTSSEIASAFVFVEEGTTNGDTAWFTDFNNSQTLGVDAVNWNQFSSAADIAAGEGLSRTGNTIDIDINSLAANTIVSADELAFYDASLGAHSKTTVTSFITDLGVLTDTDIPASEQAELAAIDALGNGMVAKTADATYAARTITASAAPGENGIVITNGDGIAGDPTIGVDIENLATAAVVGANNIMVQQGAGITATNIRRSLTDVISDLDIKSGTVAVTEGGTGLTTIPQYSVLVANAADTLVALSATDTAGNQIIQWNDTSNQFEMVTTSSIASPSGNLETITWTLTNQGNGTVAAGDSIPANATIMSVQMNITDTDATATVQIDDASGGNTIMTTAENDPSLIALFRSDVQTTNVGSVTPEAIVAGATGSTLDAEIIVTYRTG